MSLFPADMLGQGVAKGDYLGIQICNELGFVAGMSTHMQGALPGMG